MLTNFSSDTSCWMWVVSSISAGAEGGVEKGEQIKLSNFG